MMLPHAGLGGIAPGWGDEIPLDPAYAKYAMATTNKMDMQALYIHMYNLTTSDDKFIKSKNSIELIVGSTDRISLDTAQFFSDGASFPLQNQPKPIAARTLRNNGEAGTILGLNKHPPEPKPGKDHKKVEIASTRPLHTPSF